jgi:diguanylate cyclase (GGDEF)-like protein/PAS domain S-box-containing protein
VSPTDPARRLARLDALHAAVHELLALPPEEDLLGRHAAEALTRLCAARYGALALTKPEGGAVRRYFHTGLTATQTAAIGPCPSGRGLIGWVLREGRALRLDDLNAHPARTGFPPHHPPMTALLAVPLRAGAHTLGGLFLCDRLDGQPFDEEDEWLAARFAELLAPLIAQAGRRDGGGGPRRLQPNREIFTLSTAIEQTADSVLITDSQGVIEYVNAAFERTTGYSRAEALGRRSNLVKSGLMPEDFYRRLWQTIRRGEVFRDVFINRRKDGTLYYEEKTITPLRDPSGTITHFVSTGKDISERIHYEERLHHLANHDPLTGLANRALLLDRLRQAITRARWHQRLLAVLFLDLDRFKNINDALGHDVGDRLLQALAKRLTDCVREGDTVARLGGDEIAILLEDIASSEDVAAVAHKILAVFEQPFTVDGHELYAGTSIGVSLFPSDGEDPVTLLKHADIAMYRAKRQGGGHYAFFSAQMGEALAERLVLENDLRQALARGELELHYQPVVDLATGAIRGLEALVRWRHPRLGLLAPDRFIALAEESGLIVPMGKWVVREACRQLRDWETRGLLPAPFRWP